MPNPLTGDFEAVLQVSGGTVNRLLASIHQNGGTKTTLPTFVHSVRLRVGDPDPIDGMRGTVTCQVGVPRLDLIHGATDRFWLEVGIRARYKPDPGSVPIPEFIHGTIRAQYRIDPIDPACWGWQSLASEYLWIRVIADTVSFTGTAVDDVNILSIVGRGVDPAVADARITQLARVLLKTRFEATPHKVSRRFRRGAMRSLHVGANRSVVAPVGLSVDPPQGRVDSITQDLLSGRDFGVAISRDFILARIQEQLDQLRAAFTTTFGVKHRTYIDLGFLGDVDVVEVTITWTVRLTAATVQWLGPIPPVLGVNVPGGLLLVTFKGQARTQKAVFNLDFDGTQFVALSFDAASEQFTAAPFGSAAVNLSGTFAGVAESHAKPIIQAEIAGQVQHLGGGLDAVNLAKRKQELIDQLKTIDAQPNARLDEAVFTPDGVIVRGPITLSTRRGPSTVFVMTPEEDGFTALDSWIPGGRIDSFVWLWTWRNNSGSPGNDTKQDRFVLHRPPGTARGRFGIELGLHRPLPGLDGMGSICLSISGVQTHPVTGGLVQVSAQRKCTRFGLDIAVATPHRIFLREWVPGPRDPIGPVAEAAIHEVGGPGARGHGANTLVLRTGERWNREVALSLRDGLASSQRRDAGLVVLVLFPDGTLSRMGAMPEFDELRAELEAALVVNEDVHGSWSRALRLDDEGAARGELEWRLISPTGGVTWAHSGPLAPRDLASALDHFLFRSHGPAPVPNIRELALGTRVSAAMFEVGAVGRLGEIESRCPPPPLGRFDIAASVTFVTRQSAASQAVLQKMAREHERGAPEMLKVLVVDGGTAADVEDVMRSVPEGVLAVPDPEGTISRRLGVRVWPSVVTLDDTGRIVAFDTGSDAVVRPPQTGEVS